MEIQLLLPNKKPTPVQVELTETGIMVYSEDKPISFALRGELWKLFEIPAPTPTAPRDWRGDAEPVAPASSPNAAVRPNNWDWLTPEFVIEWFQTSTCPEVNQIAFDVRRALAPMTSADHIEPNHSQLAADLAILRPLRDELIDEEGNPRTGAKARVARELGGTPGGSFFYTRVLPAVEALSSASTAPESARNGQSQRSAA